MTFANKVLAAVAMLFCVVPGMAQWADPRQPSRDSLKGLPSVVVAVDLISEDPLPDDPTERELHASVEKRLSDAGIIVYKRPRGASDDHPTLTVSVSITNLDIFYSNFLVDTALRQRVKLATNPQLNLTAPTWEERTGSFGTLNPKHDQINNFIDQFICDFRKANPGLTGPLPNCAGDIRFFENRNNRDNQGGKRPTVMTEREDQLLRAAALNHSEQVKSLIAAGADVNAYDHADATPLTYAVRSGHRKLGDPTVVLLLLEQGANPNVSPSCRLTPLMYAVQRGDLKVVEALLNHGADVNAATPEGFTVLMAASTLGSPDAVTLLLKNNANVGARTRNGLTALMFAKANIDRIAAYDRPRFEPPYTSIPEAELLKSADETRACHRAAAKFANGQAQIARHFILTIIEISSLLPTHHSLLS